MPKGGARLGAGSAPNLNKTIDLLRRQVDWIESQADRRPVDLALYAVRLNVQVNRLLTLAGIERPPSLSQAERDAAHDWAVAAVAEEEANDD